MIHLPDWRNWQAGIINKVRRTRRGRGLPEDLPYSMTQIVVAASFGRRFAAYAAFVGPQADAYFMRVLQYTAHHAAFTGNVAVQRNAFGPVVLTRPWDIVSAKKGAIAYDALVASGLALAGEAPPASPPDDDGEATPESPQEAPPEASRGARPVAPCVGVGVGVSSNNPPSPRAGGRAGLRPRDRERFDRVLDYVVRCGSLGERAEVVELRRRHRENPLPDAEIAALLDGKFRWVTRDKLARAAKETA